MIKTVKVSYKGKSVPIKIEDDLAFGKLKAISDRHIKIAELIDGKIPKTIHEFIFELIEVVVVEAPWDIKEDKWLSKLGYRTVKDLARIVTAEYPLEDFLKVMTEMFKVNK